MDWLKGIEDALERGETIGPDHVERLIEEVRRARKAAATWQAKHDNLQLFLNKKHLEGENK